MPRDEKEYTFQQKRLDTFASAALTGLLAKGAMQSPSFEDVARVAFHYAAAMVMEADRREEILRETEAEG